MLLWTYMDSWVEFIGHHWYARVVILIIVLFAAQYIIRRFSTTIIRRLVRPKNFSTLAAERQREDTLISVVNKVTGSVVWIIGICLILSQLNFNWAGLLAGAGVLGVVVGFGAQKVFGDFLSGFFILLENQYGIGDIVEVGDMAYGTVEAVHLRTTHIRNLDGGLHIIANSQIVNMANHSYGFATALVYLWVEYDTDIKKVEKIMNDVGHDMMNDPVWKNEIKEVVSYDRVEDYGADGLKVRATGTTAPGMQWGVAGEYRARLKLELDKAGIKPAYPHRIMVDGAKHKDRKSVV